MKTPKKKKIAKSKNLGVLLPINQPIDSPVFEIREVNATPHFKTQQEDWFGVFNPTLLESVRVQWLMEDWDSLHQIKLEQLTEHLDGAKIALFVATAHAKKDDFQACRAFLEFARKKGCPPQLISEILLDGIHSSMVQVCLMTGNENQALEYHRDRLTHSLLPRTGVAPRQLLLSQGKTHSADEKSTEGIAWIPPRVARYVRQAWESNDIRGTLVSILINQGFSKRERFLLMWQLAEKFSENGNKLVASGYLHECEEDLPAPSLPYARLLAKSFLKMNLPEDAAGLLLRFLPRDEGFTEEESELLGKGITALGNKIQGTVGHGHEVLLAFLNAHGSTLRTLCAGRSPVLIEIGTTREAASGQGSTSRLAEFCFREGFDFMTVDMDKANAGMASDYFKRKSMPFKAVHSTGESFLRSYDGPIDILFLDAYDFDHGNHTELRQSRYEKYLGSRIDDAQCHRMHLECCESFVSKMSPWSILCLDDTWLDTGKWTAKGNLAVPYLMESGLRLLDIRNRAILMGTDFWLSNDAEKLS